MLSSLIIILLVTNYSHQQLGNYQDMVRTGALIEKHGKILIVEDVVSVSIPWSQLKKLTYDIYNVDNTLKSLQVALNIKASHLSASESSWFGSLYVILAWRINTTSTSLTTLNQLLIIHSHSSSQRQNEDFLISEVLY